MNTRARIRGPIAVYNNTPNEILSELTTVFAGFRQNSEKKIDGIENSIDEINSTLASFRLNGFGGGGQTADSKKAMNAFGSFVKTGQTEAMDAMRPQNASTTDNDPSGGYLVPKEIGETIVRRQVDFSPMRRLAFVRPVNSDSYEQLINAGGGTAQWVGERESRPETAGPNWKALNFVAHEIYANPSVSQKLLDDSAFNIASEVTQAIAEDFDEKEGASFISGDGILKPRGFLSYPTPVTTTDATRAFGTLQYVPTGVAAALSDMSHNGGDALIDVVYSLRAGYRTNASWLMNSATAGTVRKFKDLEGRYLWQDSLAAGQPPSLCGYPVAFDENMQDVGANAFPIAFGDWKRGYMITDRIGVRILRDPYSSKPFVMFYATKRVGGGLLHSDAIKLLKVAAT